MMIDRVIQLAIPTADTPRAIRFYRDVLGLRLLFEAPPSMAFFDVDGIRLLVGPGAVAPKAGEIIYFNTPDIQAAAARLREHGITAEPHMIAQLANRDVWLAEFSDPDGNTLALMSEVKR